MKIVIFRCQYLNDKVWKIVYYIFVVRLSKNKVLGDNMKFNANEFQRKLAKREIVNISEVDKGEIKKKISKINDIFEYEERDYYIDRNGSLTKEDSEKDTLISDFFFAPRYGVEIERVDGIATYVSIDLYILKRESIINLIIDEDDLRDKNWISNYVSEFGISISRNEEFLFVYNILKNRNKSFYKYIMENRGWSRVETLIPHKFFINKSENKYLLKYLVRRKCNKCFSFSSNDYIPYRSMLSIMDSMPQCFVIPLFSYCILALTNQFFREIKKEPEFILMLVGSKKSNIMQLTELFVSNMNPEKTIRSRCENLEHYDCMLDLDYCTYPIEGIEKIKTKLVCNKDKALLIDAMMDSENKLFANIEKHLLHNYIVKNNERLVEDDLNALPVIVTDKDFSNHLYLRISVDQGIISKEMISQIRREEHIITETVYLFIQWLEGQMKEEDIFLQELRNEYETCIRNIGFEEVELNHREIKICSWLITAYKLFLNFGVSRKYITKIEYDDYYKKALKTVLNTLNLDLDEKIYSGLTVIKHIYDHFDSELLTSNESKTRDKIGWIIKDANDDEIVYIPNSSFDRDINKYLKKYPELQVNIIRQIVKKDIIDILLDKGLIKTSKGRKDFRLSLTGNKGFEYCLAFKMSAVTEYLETFDKINSD